MKTVNEQQTAAVAEPSSPITKSKRFALRKDPAQLYPHDQPWDIKAEGITYTYDRKLPTRFTAVNDFSHIFERNRIYCVVGNSGSGKSTLIQHFNGLLKAEKGDVWIKGQHINPKKRKIKHIKYLRRRVSLVFQFPEYQLFKDTIEKDIMFGPLALGVPKPEARVRAKKYLVQLGLDESYLQRSPFELSGGQKRRVAIAGILAIETDIVIFDEPTAGLDPAGEQEMMDIITALKDAGRTIIVVTHNMNHVLEIADEVIVLLKGSKVKSGTPFEIFKDGELISNSSLDKPMVYKVIDALVKRNPALLKLYDQEIRTVEDLAKALGKSMSGKK